MQIPPEIAFQHVEPSDDIRALIAEKITLLEKIYDGIISAHIQIRAPHQRKQTGNLFCRHDRDPRAGKSAGGAQRARRCCTP